MGKFTAELFGYKKLIKLKANFKNNLLWKNYYLRYFAYLQCLL
jgi:hypothetical protein